MTYQVLARRWRPQAFEQMVGQEHVLRALVNALERNRLHHAYLLTGTRGVGKTTLARLLAKCLNCERGVSAKPCGECSACREIAEGRFVDLLEVDAASRTKVEDTRDLLDNVLYAPARGRYKVYLIDEVHMLSGHSFNALLKTLEEPPPHVKFLLATTDPQRLPATVLSRCLQLHLRNLAPEQIAAHLAHVLRAESIAFEDPALWDLALAADGSMRDALSLADQAIAHGAGTVTALTVTEMLGHLDREQLHALTDALLAADAAAVLRTIDALAAHGIDCERALAELLALLHRIALVQAVPAALDSLHESNRERIGRWAESASAADVQLYYQVGLHARRDLPHAPDARAGLEMALLRMLAFRPAGAPRVVVTAPAQEAVGAAKKPDPADAPAGASAARVTRALPAVAVVPAPVLTAPTASAVVPAQEQTSCVPGEPATIDAGNWEALLAVLDVSGAARSCAAHAVPERVADGTLYLVLQEAHAALQGPGAQQRLAAALERHFGRPLAVSIRLGSTAGAETPAESAARGEEERRQQAARRIAADANVRLLVEAFEGELHAETIRAAGAPAQDAAQEEPA